MGGGHSGSIVTHNSLTVITGDRQKLTVSVAFNVLFGTNKLEIPTCVDLFILSFVKSSYPCVGGRTTSSLDSCLA